MEFKPIRLVAASYNIHSCVGRDGRCEPERIVEVLREIGPDIVGLQEVGHRRGRRLRGDQYPFLISATGMHAVTGHHAHYERAEFGNMLLSRWPFKERRAVDLTIAGSEPRGAIDAEIAIGPQALRIVVAHLGLHPAERWRQVNRIGHAIREHGTAPVLVMGDFNIWGAERRLLRRLGGSGLRRDHPATFPARFPVLALDRIWTLPLRLVVSMRPHRTPLSAIASDHLPIVAEITITSPTVRPELARLRRPIGPWGRRFGDDLHAGGRSAP
jgi:endonuclease/exonuclease/phosphatase family metal-dependent hydrolase